MKIKNNYTAPIGFGAVSVLPDETKELPKGYSENHPTLKYYISRGWIEIMQNQTKQKETVKEKPQTDVTINIDGNEFSSGEKAETSTETKAKKQRK